MNAMRAMLPCLALLFAAFGAAAAEVDELEVKKSEGRYHITMDARLAAPPKAVHSVLVDYANLTQINGAIVESRLLESDGEHALVYTRVRGCVAFFCRSVEKVETFLQPHPFELVADADPERSDFRYLHSRWLVEPHEDGARMQFEMEMRPGFWIPPLIGPALLRRKLREEALQTLDLIEAAAPHYAR